MRLTPKLIAAAICIYPQVSAAEVCSGYIAHHGDDMCSIMFNFNRTFLVDTFAMDSVSLGITEVGKPLAFYRLSVGSSRSQIEAGLKANGQLPAEAVQRFDASLTEQICSGYEMGSFVRAGGTVVFQFSVSADETRPLSMSESFTSVTITSCEAP
jgi:hypothetical protein